MIRSDVCDTDFAVVDLHRVRFPEPERVVSTTCFEALFADRDSGNVSSDLGLPDAGAHLVKAELVSRIYDTDEDAAPGPSGRWPQLRGPGSCRAKAPLPALPAQSGPGRDSGHPLGTDHIP